ncbi:MAG: GntR family histidine utilization transcriptional repressor [Motiliproteus sp.]
MSTKPRYQQIKDFIVDAINQGIYLPGSKIPTEIELAAQFEVSRMTANKAIRDLVQDSRLVRYAGLGTFVTAAKAESPLLDIRNIADEVRQRGHRYSGAVMLLEQSSANDAMALQLGTPVGTPLFHSVIVHSEDDLPIQLEERFVIASLVPGYLEQDFSNLTPNEYLSRNCPISSVEHIVEAVLAAKDAQRLLAIDAGTPCILVQRRTWSNNQLVSFARLTHPGPRYKLRSLTQLTS